MKLNELFESGAEAPDSSLPAAALAKAGRFASFVRATSVAGAFGVRRFTAAFSRLLTISAAWAIVANSASGAQALPLKLWYDAPAKVWTEALPIGNGYMGAMIFGGTENERIQFNEDTLWRGQPHDYVRAGAGEQLSVLQKMIADGKIKDAEQLIRQKFLSDPVRQKAYQPFGDLRLHFSGLTNAQDYRRELDLDSAVASTTYRVDEVTYRREAFASYPDRAIVVRLSADHRGRINFTLGMDSPHTNSHTAAIGSDALSLTGEVEEGGLRFESRVRAVSTGGKVSVDGSQLKIENADSVTLFLTAATSFKNFQDISADPSKRCSADLAKVSQQKTDDVLKKHLEDHRALFRRVSLDIGGNRGAVPTDRRLSEVRSAGLDADPSLAALYFQYGRYLLIASSRPGAQPANLQGVWNDDLKPPWESKYTLNINCEMNYWPAEIGNLSECHEPLFDMIDDLTVSGARTAKKQYNCRGWVVHHNTDLWRGSAPINNIDGVWPTGGAWLCHHLWEHYLFTGDEKFLAKRAYPVMKQACEFFMDFMIKDPKTGWLVTSPSYSPEEGSLCAGPAMDSQLIRALMDHTIEAAKILNTDKAFILQLTEVRRQVAPDQIGKHGQLQEWLQDIDVENNNHRHMSPLFALYPGCEITPANTNLFNAAKVLLKWRGDGSTGWSYAWRIPLWARVGDGEFAYRQLSELLKRRTLPNLFDLCGPFQIDGNFGASAGMIEMLLQSQQTEVGSRKSEVRVIDLLPALPKAWANGSVKGLCAREGFEVDMDWKDGALTHAVIRSKLGNPCVVRCGNHEAELQTKRGGEYALNGELKSAQQ